MANSKGILYRSLTFTTRYIPDNLIIFWVFLMLIFFQFTHLPVSRDALDDSDDDDDCVGEAAAHDGGYGGRRGGGDPESSF